MALPARQATGGYGRIDWPLALRRACNDQPDRVFIRHPLEIPLVEIDIDLWLSDLQTACEAGQYNPSPLTVCSVPKPGGLVRPGGYLPIADRVVYVGLLGLALPAVRNALNWTREPVDLAYRLAADPDSPDLFQSRFQGWTDFRVLSIQRLEQGATHVVVTDIAGYYDHISLTVLASDLAQAGVPDDVRNPLSTSLNRWAHVPGTGIPQGFSPSDLLGKLYLNSVDQNLRNMGYDHLRYVDDFRIFASSEAGARRAILNLAELLRLRGLSLQSAKTHVLTSPEARLHFEGITPVVQEVRRQMVAEAQALLDEEDPYLYLAEAEDVLRDQDDALSPAFIRGTFTEYFINRPFSDFNKTLFHFLLNRLAGLQDTFAIDYCLAALYTHPEETAPILGYLHSVEALQGNIDYFVPLLESEDFVFHYQAYLILEFILSRGCRTTPQMLGVVRNYSFDPRLPAYLRGVARLLLGRDGLPADLERLRAQYVANLSDLERCEIITALQRLEPGMRNAFLARAESDSPATRRAVRLVRQGPFLDPP